MDMFPPLVGVGYDSEEVKATVIEEFFGAVAGLKDAKRRLEMADSHAVCFVCEAELYPFPADPNHHVATTGDPNDPLHHYCSAHCPACNQP